MKTDILQDCPGFWYGNHPNMFGNGNMVIDPAKAVDAIRWLSKRAKIIETAVQDKGLMIAFALRKEQTMFAD